jgi:hypothetical protein
MSVSTAGKNTKYTARVGGKFREKPLHSSYLVKKKKKIAWS